MGRWLQHFWVRNGLALAALMLAIYLPDLYAVRQRTGWMAWSPYAFLVLLYGWLVFHNRILFERLFERGKRREYAAWTALALIVSTVNMWLILHFGYGIWPVPILIRYYLFTLTGLGVYVLYRQLTRPGASPVPANPIEAGQVVAAVQTAPPFTIQTDDGPRQLDPATIRYVESLENYVRVVTTTTTYLTRLTLKQAETDLTPHGFLRISRSHLINPRFVTRWQGDDLLLDGQTLRIGRTYKQHVAGRLRQSTSPA